MKNVLFFTHSLSGGGAEKTVRQVARYINANNYDCKVYVCVVYDDPAYHGEVDDTESNKREDVDAFIKGHRVIINVGRLAKQKGQVHLLKAFARALKTYPDIRLLILGEGPLRQQLQDSW